MLGQHLQDAGVSSGSGPSSKVSAARGLTVDTDQISRCCRSRWSATAGTAEALSSRTCWSSRRSRRAGPPASPATAVTPPARNARRLIGDARGGDPQRAGCSSQRPPSAAVRRSGPATRPHPPVVGACRSSPTRIALNSAGSSWPASVLGYRPAGRRCPVSGQSAVRAGRFEPPRVAPPGPKLPSRRSSGCSPSLHEAVEQGGCGAAVPSCSPRPAPLQQVS
jgi:hypothetical protein